MNNLFIYLISWLITHGPLDRTKRVNDTLEWAERSYGAKNYPSAIRKFRYLTDSLRVTDVNVKLNLSHALFNNQDTLDARMQYERLDSIQDKEIASVALQQLGVLAGNRNEIDKALAYFKQTLKTDPANEDARYNYELLRKKKASEEQKQLPPPKQKQEQEQQERQKQEEERKKAEEKKKQLQSQQDESQKAEDQKAQEKNAKEDENGQNKKIKDKKEKSEEGESKERRMSQERLKEINISEDKARTILDAMKNSEIQYLQQKKRPPTGQKQADKNPQDW